MSDNEYEEQLRIEAVKRYLKGENPSRIYKSINRSKDWFFKWLNRYKGGGSLWYKNLPRVPKTIHRSVEPHTEEIIIKVRKRDSKIQSTLK